jgi:hypothetical protein
MINPMIAGARDVDIAHTGINSSQFAKTLTAAIQARCYRIIWEVTVQTDTHSCG